ncbi:MAG: branched-chain amino acid ABC transporter permease [Actinomycetota bacterium]
MRSDPRTDQRRAGMCARDGPALRGEPTVSTLSQLLPLTIAGIVLGTMYALPAMGIVLIYKTSRVLNFAHGAIGMFSTFIAYQVGIVWGLPIWLAVLAAVVFAGLLGAFIERFTIRPLEGRPPLTKVVVTLGWLLLLTSLAGFIWGASAYHAPIQIVPEATVQLPGVRVSYLQLMTLGLASGLTVLLALFFRVTRLGLAMRAVADNVQAARILGVRVDLVNSAAWALGSILAAIAGVLLSPMITLDTIQLTLLVVSAFAAALAGGLVSLPATFAAAVLLGVLQSDVVIWVRTSGAKSLITLGIVLVAMLWRRSRLAEVLDT